MINLSMNYHKIKEFTLILRNVSNIYILVMVTLTNEIKLNNDLFWILCGGQGLFWYCNLMNMDHFVSILSFSGMKMFMNGVCFCFNVPVEKYSRPCSVNRGLRAICFCSLSSNALFMEYWGHLWSCKNLVGWVVKNLFLNQCYQYLNFQKIFWHLELLGASFYVILASFLEIKKGEKNIYSRLVSLLSSGCIFYSGSPRLTGAISHWNEFPSFL